MISATALGELLIYQENMVNCIADHYAHLKVSAASESVTTMTTTTLILILTLAAGMIMKLIYEEDKRWNHLRIATKSNTRYWDGMI